jgi:hypothetical protein
VLQLIKSNNIFDLSMHDFHETYKTYSNKELIKIIEQPQLYQPFAVDAARSILSHRQPKESDFEEATREINEAAVYQNPTQVFLKKVRSTLEYLFIPTDTFDPKRWIYLLTIGHALWWGWTAKPSLQLLLCAGCELSLKILMIVEFALVAICMTLLLLRRKLGWKLIVFYSTVLVLSSLSTLVFQYRYIDPLLELLGVAINAGVLGVFVKSEMRQYFAVEDVNIVSFLVKCVVICVMIAIVFMYSTA